MTSKHIMINCKHAFCKECTAEYFRSLVEDQGKHHSLKCPAHNCGKEPTAEEIAALLTNETFSKYSLFQLNLKVALAPELLFCANT